MSSAVDMLARKDRFFHGPAWRWQRAQLRMRASSTHMIAQADTQLRDVLAFLRLLADGHAQRAAKRYPHIQAAVDLNENAAVRDQAKVLVLGGCDPEQIAERFSLDLRTLATWEAIFYDVRSVRTALDWIVAKVISPEQARGQGQLAAQLRIAAAAGPFTSQAVLDACSTRIMQSGLTLLEKKMRLHVKYDEAQKVPLRTKKEAFFFVKLSATLRYQDKRLAQAERRLELKSQEILDKARARSQRLELLRQRQQAEEAARAHREAEQNERDPRRQEKVLRREKVQGQEERVGQGSAA